jgi:hypothetical protein
MATRDPLIPNNRAGLLVADHTGQSEQSEIGRAWKRGISSRVAKTIVSVCAVAAIAFAIAAIGSPSALFVSASQVSASAPEDSKGPSMPAIQSTASAQALPPAAEEPTKGGELLAAFRTALESKTEFESKTEVDQPRADALFNQFRAWAAAEDVPPQVVRPSQPIQDAPAPVVQKAHAPPLPKRRPIQTAHSQAPPAQTAQWPIPSLGWHN